ncbi:hypothetical protein [Neomegalonema sp.]|uniref:hypothetical protein n=1 Tax=Neomegalonema sp. TaxID=2039713 RepID=UPI0026104762|nr:hypothetical protein [Neomegalonema sp.]MDD2867257.1 hypothetical protein [Neomegalonema sp.]
MSDKFSPPIERDRQKINLEFDRQHRAYLTSHRCRSPRSIDRGDLANRMALQFDDAYRTNESFREYVGKHGVGAVRQHPFWRRWLAWEISEQWRQHFGAMPRMTTSGQNLFLRLAACRQDGMLFPLVGDRLPDSERLILKKLLDPKMKKVWEVPTEENLGVWARDADLGPVTLRPTDKGFGGGHQDLEFLLSCGYLEKQRCDAPNQLWRYEENVATTLRLTEAGRTYRENLMNGGSLVSIDHAYEAYGDFPDDESGAEDLVDREAFKTWSADIGLQEVLDFAVSVYQMPEDQALAYLLLKKGEAPDDNPWTLAQVSKRINKSTSTISRLKQKWDDHFENPEVLSMLNKHFRSK